MTGAARPKTSLVNIVTRRLLRLPVLRRLVEGRVCELRFVAARSGREVVLPVMYAQRDDRVVVLVGRSRSKRWWRSFVAPHPVDVWIRGQLHPGRGHVVLPGTAERAGAEETYAKRYPAIKPGDEPFVVITLETR